MNHIFLNQYLNAVALRTTGRTFGSGESHSTQTAGGLIFNLYRPVDAHGNVQTYYHQILCRLCMTWTRRNLSTYIPAASIELQLEILAAQLNLTTTQLSDEFISQTSK